MNDSANRALLPAGLPDILPPEAQHEASVVALLMEGFAGQGFDPVKPPLIEFEDSLFAGPGAALARSSFRLMDPASGRMLAVRPDMTPQISRIAATRMSDAPRPLRLSYAGEVLRVKASQLRPERQFVQAGIELIGSASCEADAEVVRLAHEGLESLGIEGVSVDLTLPTLVPALCQGLDLSADDLVRLRDALDHKDPARLAGLPGQALFEGLLRASGPVGKALAALEKLKLSDAALSEIGRLKAVAAAIQRDAPGMTLTVDAVESRGFEYHCGVAFTLFAKGQSFELGRGGRYAVDGEPATGVTLFMDTVLKCTPLKAARPRLYLPVGTSWESGQSWRAKGYATVAGLESVTDAKAEAKRLGCGFWLNNNEIKDIKES
ncbi:ATP phosphoribosyltransferase regulatory subunit [Rhodospirillaceae bacterium LM-1]|nr:ATP phosphoribosyltransferase regulatory subunit [Rhodospirillaceae bacterium LM-1]